MNILRKTKIENHIKQNQSVIVLGPRNTGKSYYLSQLVANSEHSLTINLLDVEIYKRYLANASLLKNEIETKLQKISKLIIFIDEIQKLPPLLDIVHLLIETYHERLQFILTGSSARKLKKSNANLLAGRALMHHFTNLTIEEIDFTKYFNSIMQFGLLPAVFLQDNEELKIEMLRTYTGTYLKEEIMQEALVRNIEGFHLFLELAAQSNGACVNYTKMARQIKISDSTIKEHYQILEDTLIATRLPAWTHSVKKQLQSASKYYFFDNGILNSLRGELRTELKNSSFRFGQLFENLVINEIIKYNQIHRLDYKLFHYRTYNGGEIDIIIQKNNSSSPIAVEIKSSSSPDETELTALKEFKQDHENAKLFVLCLTPAAYQSGEIKFISFPEGVHDLFKLD